MKSPLYNVLHRELRRMTSRRLYLGICLVLPLFCLFFMATIFGSGQMENILLALSTRTILPHPGKSHEYICRTYFQRHTAFYRRSRRPASRATQRNIWLPIYSYRL